MNSRMLPGAGSVLSALASSACCWLPVLLMGAGLSAAGIGAFLERMRPLFLIVAAALLALGFYLNYLNYLNYFRRERCGPGAACEPNPVLRRMNRVVLWISAVLVLALGFFPAFVGRLPGAEPTEAGSAPATTDTWELAIRGMTCAGCEAAINRALTEVPGVVHANALHETASATVAVDPASPPARTALAAAVGRAGYSLVSVNPEQSATAEPGFAGHWVAELEEPNGDSIEVVLDLGIVNSRWVGEFDLPEYGVLDYPIEVSAGDETIDLFLTAIGASFQGGIDEDGLLAGVGRSPGVGDESITFRRTGRAEFSAGFLELEAAAGDSSLVERLSDDGRELQQRFNADSSKTRLLMLLSPT